VYVHKSFYEYFAAAHLFSALISRSESVPEAFKTFISAEVAGFLKGMLVEGASEVEKHIAVKSLIGVYQSFQESKSEREILARQQATHYLGRLGTREAVKFLEKSLESEPDKWVHRGIILGLALFCEQPKQTSQYISELEKDEEAASINIGYHLAYYGDQEFREDGADYYDRGHPECKWTVRAILRHLQTLDYSASWPLDLFTLRLLLESKVRSENAMLALHEDPRQWDFLSNRLDEYQHYADPVIVSNSSRIKEILRDRL
jgi:HEAT repeat protein